MNLRISPFNTNISQLAYDLKVSLGRLKRYSYKAALSDPFVNKAGIVLRV